MAKMAKMTFFTVSPYVDVFVGESEAKMIYPLRGSAYEKALPCAYGGQQLLDVGDF